MRWFSILAILFHICIFGHTEEKSCGRVSGSARLFGKIVGGYDVGYYKYPWFAALLLDGTPWCGGTLIGEDVVVTAAHCYRKYIQQPGAKLENIFTVKLGIYRSCKTEKTQKEFKVKQVIVHELYMKKKPYYDIAVIILQGDSSSFEPACLPPSVIKDTHRGKDAYIIGLGTLNFSQDSYPCNLHEGRVLLYSDKTCKDMIRRTTDDKEDYPMTNALCAGYMEGGVDACQGDSGGPIMIIEPEGRYVLLGLTSFGYECAVKDQLGLYTDVSKYLDWIYEKTRVTSRLITTTTTTTPITEPTYDDNDLQFNISNFLPTYSNPPLVYQEVPNTAGQQANYDPSYVQQINNNNPYQNIQHIMDITPPKRIIIEFKKRRNPIGHRRRKLRRPHRRYFKEHVEEAHKNKAKHKKTHNQIKKHNKKH